MLAVGFFIRITIHFKIESKTHTWGITSHPTGELWKLLPYVSGKYSPIHTNLLEPM